MRTKASDEPDPDAAVPEGPTDLAFDGDPESATQTTELTRGRMTMTNTHYPGGVRAAVVGTRAFSGPGPVATQSFTVPATARPGTVYTLAVEGMVVNCDAKSVPFTPVSGSLTVVPTRAPLPPVDQPPLTGPILGVGHLYAHRGDHVVLTILAGDGLTAVCSFDVKIAISAHAANSRPSASKAASTGASGTVQGVPSGSSGAPP